MRQTEEMMTREEAEAWVDERAALIFVRENLGDGWGSHSLADLPPQIRAPHRERLVQRKMQGVPVYALRAEMASEQK